MRQNATSIILFAMPFAMLLMAWEVWASSSSQTAFLLGQPTAIFSILLDEVRDGGLLADLAVTLICAIIGMVFGLLIGFATGVIVATSHHADRAFSPIVNLLSVIPLFAIGPLLVFAAGQGFAPKVLLSALSVGFYTVALTYQNVKLTPTAYVEAVRIQSGSDLAVTRYAQIPYSALRLVTNLRVLFGAAVTGTIVGEFLGASAGIGRFIVVAEGLFDVNRIWVGIVLLSLASVGVALCLMPLEKFARLRLGKE